MNKRKNMISAFLCAALIISGCEEVSEELEYIRKEDHTVSVSETEESARDTGTQTEAADSVSSPSEEAVMLTILSETEITEISAEAPLPKGDVTTVISLNLEKKSRSKRKKTTVTTSETPPSENEYDVISWDKKLKYADFSAIHTDPARLYYSRAKKRKNITVAVNAGHGTSGAYSTKTYCHPDKSPKHVTGSTAAGATKSVCISGGMEFPDGTPEAKYTLAVAVKVKEKLLSAGYDVLMLRETDDCQLDNIARTVLANKYADCHISIHFDSSSNNKGAFFIGVPDVKAYKSMEPVASHWKEHDRLGEKLIDGLKGEDIKIYSSGRMDIDLTQTSFSTVPSVDLELGDKGTAVTEDFINKAANGIVSGVDSFFGK